MNEPVKIVAEIGLNHNGNMDKAKRLIDIAAVAGCDFVKFQKRNPDLCVPEEQKEKPKKVPWRKEETTYLQYKKVETEVLPPSISADEFICLN